MSKINFTSQKTWFVIIFAAVLLLIVFFAASSTNFLPSLGKFFKKQPPKTVDNNGPSATTSPVADPRVMVDKNIVPGAFPTDFPWEKNAQILENNIVPISDSRQQASRQYVSQKTMSQNYTELKKYLADKKWSIVNTIDTDNLKTIVATDGSKMNQMLINISKNSLTNQVVVDVTLVYPIFKSGEIIKDFDIKNYQP